MFFFCGSVQIRQLGSKSKFQMFTCYWQPYWWSKEVHQHGGSIAGSVNLHKTFQQISRLEKPRDLKFGEKSSLLRCIAYKIACTISRLYITDYSYIIKFNFLLCDSCENDL